jgi:hypothetical protein
VMSREVISWIAGVAVGALFVAILLWVRSFVSYQGEGGIGISSVCETGALAGLAPK